MQPIRPNFIVSSMPIIDLSNYMHLLLIGEYSFLTIAIRKLQLDIFEVQAKIPGFNLATMQLLPSCFASSCHQYCTVIPMLTCMHCIYVEFVLQVWHFQCLFCLVQRNCCAAQATRYYITDSSIVFMQFKVA